MGLVSTQQATDMPKLGVLYFVGSFPELSESFILNEITELHNRGYDVAVFARNKAEVDITHTEYESLDIPIYYAKASYTDFPQLISNKPIRMARNNATMGFFKQLPPKQIGHNLLIGRKCAEFIESLDFEINVVHTHFASPSNLGGMLAARYNNILCTVTAHAIEIFRTPNVHQIKYICDSMDHVVVPSEYNRQYLREEIGIENEMTVVPATTRIEKFEASGPTIENRLLTVARLVEKKGYPYGLEAVNKLIEQGYNIEYHIVGTGDRKQRLQQQIEELGIQDSVEFLGYVSDERLQKELSEASVFMLPCVIAEDGDRDAMPVALKEAMASETACVSTTVSAIPELISHGHDGLLVPEKKSEELANAVKEFLDNPEKRKRIAENGRKTVYSKFDISESVDTLTDVFESL
jgi:glycosyltransferase involved in cell wall biosynthesis